VGVPAIVAAGSEFTLGRCFSCGDWRLSLAAAIFLRPVPQPNSQSLGQCALSRMLALSAT